MPLGTGERPGNDHLLCIGNSCEKGYFQQTLHTYIHTYQKHPRVYQKGYPVPCTYHAHPQFVGQVKIDFIEASLGIPKTEPVSPLCVIPNLVLSIQFSCCRYDTGLEFIIHTSDAPVDCKLPKAQVPSQFIPGSLHQAQCLQDVFDIG